MPNTYLTLQQLNNYLQEIVAEVFAAPLWVVAEIADLKQAASGHLYLELVEKSGSTDATMVAKAQAVIWHNKGTELRQRFGSDLSNLLKKGNKVLFKAQLDYHAVYGLKLIISDIDASVTLGELELRRRQAIEQLEANGLLYRNAELSLPTVIQQIAVISSPTAAGYIDFMNHLEHNTNGYKVNCALFQSAMQGDAVLGDMTAQLKAIAHHAQQFDAVVIIRGGGSKLDLEAFNDLNLATIAAQMPLPIICGIGHQQDESVLDLVAHTALKTPTAVAEFILQSFMNFEAELIWCAEQVKKATQYKLQTQQHLLRELQVTLHTAKQLKQQRQHDILNRCQDTLQRMVRYKLERQNNLLHHLEQTFALFDVQRLLNKGFAIVRKNGTAVSNTQQLNAQDIVSITLANGEIGAIVQ